MRTLKILSISALITFICATPFLHSTETVVINRSFHNREIKVRAGSMIQVELDELGSAGYEWSIRRLDAEHFEVLKTGVKDTPSSNGLTGAPVKKTWLILSKKAGKAELTFLHYRSWEGEKEASDTFTVRVRIIP